MSWFASAPGKLMLTGEYAVLDGAPALVVAVDRRARARRELGPRGSSPFLVAIADELARRFGADHPNTRAALEIAVDSSAMFDGAQKLGLGSSAAVTVAATALALAEPPTQIDGRAPPTQIDGRAPPTQIDGRAPPTQIDGRAPKARVPVIDRELVASIAYAAHANAQARRGAHGTRGSGADVAAAVHGGVIAFHGNQPIERLSWPAGVTWIPFFTGVAADTPALVAAVAAARAASPTTVNAALTSIAEISRAACRACGTRATEVAATAVLSALSLAAVATDQLAIATRLPLVPRAVQTVRAVAQRLGGTAKTTGAGGGDIAVAVIPATEDAAIVRRSIIEAGCKPLTLTVDHGGVDLHPAVQ